MTSHQWTQIKWLGYVLSGSGSVIFAIWGWRGLANTPANNLAVLVIGGLIVVSLVIAQFAAGSSDLAHYYEECEAFQQRWDEERKEREGDRG